ncbi:MAG: long-chain fatty acid--CoA ligase [Sphingomonadales bacterium]|nr:long-chain fatty acid--CoA ligase [Sphingomonadales bacterium]
MQLSDFAACNNLVSLFLARAGEKGDAPMLWARREGQWQSQGWAETARQVCLLAESLRRLGLEPGDRVMLVSENRPEWCVADLAIMAAGCVTVPAYITNTERDHLHVLENAGARAVIVASARLAKPLLPAVLRSSQTDFVIGMEDLPVQQAGSVSFHRWDDLVAGDAAGARRAVAARVATIGRGELACLIYTSGTGGAPRGVMQHHGAILSNVAGACAILAEDFGWGDEVFLSFLPLSHAYEHTGGQFLPIGMGGQIFYAEGLEKLSANIAEVRPTLMIVVPRLFEVLRSRILREVERQGTLACFLLDRALALAMREAQGQRRLRDVPLRLLLEHTLRPKLRAQFGGRIKAMVSGGAPLNPDVGIFFEAMGLTLLQGYGQTECGPVISCNRPSAGIRMDTVGPPLAGVEVRIAADGEILARGEPVMLGYWRNPSETQRVLEADPADAGAPPWLHTGDIGLIDEKGRIRITDRKKDMIVNDKGDNISPQKLEGMLTLQPEIAQAMVCGDRRPYVVALIVPDAEWALGWATAQDEPADLAALQDLPAFRSAVRDALDRVNGELSVIERIRQFTFADEPFAIANEEMTPSLKIRRHKLRERYGPRLDALYRG